MPLVISKASTVKCAYSNHTNKHNTAIKSFIQNLVMENVFTALF